MQKQIVKILSLHLAIISVLLLGCGKASEEPTQSQAMLEDGTPSVLPNTLVIKKQKQSFVITGIGSSGSNKVAIINNQVVKPGAALAEGVVLEDIGPTYATIRVGDQHHLLRPEDIQRNLDEKKK